VLRSSCRLPLPSRWELLSVCLYLEAYSCADANRYVDGIVGHTSTATDKAGRSIPAPGRGILGTGREITPKYPVRTLDLDYRRRQLDFRRRQISEWLDNEISLLKSEAADSRARGEKVDEEELADRVASIEREARRQQSDASATFGMLEGQDPSVAPLRRALAVWGLTIDDVGVASVSSPSCVSLSGPFLLTVNG
jgi:3-oxoacyl-(acyl-carrier-protein) synthase